MMSSAAAKQRKQQRQRQRHKHHKLFVVVLLSMLSSLAVTACGLVFDFDDFDVSPPPVVTDDGAGPVRIESPNAMEFVIEELSAVRVAPGTSTTVPITIARVPGTGESRRINFALRAGACPSPSSSKDAGGDDAAADATASDPPANEVFEPFEPIESILAATPNATADASSLRATTHVRLSIKSSAIPQQQRLCVSATSGAIERVVTLLVMVRGEPCSIDRTFGTGGRLAHPVHSGPRLPLLKHHPRHAVSGLYALEAVEPAAPELRVGSIDEASGSFLWDTVLGPRIANATTLIAVANDGIYAASDDSIERIEHDGGKSEPYVNVNDSGLPPTSFCAGLVDVVRDDPDGVAMLCLIPATESATGLWRLDRWRPDASRFQGLPIDTYVKTTDSKPRALVRSSKGTFTGCGTVHTVLAPQMTVVRWAPDPLRIGTLWGDPSFGSEGRFALPRYSEAIACAADERGPVVLGTVNSLFSLVGLKADGTVDEKFGDEGVVTVALGKSGVPTFGGDGGLTPFEGFGPHFLHIFDEKIIAIGEPTIRDTKTTDRAYLAEYARDGRLLFTCDLSDLPLEVKRLISVTFDGFGRAYLFNGGDESIARIWL
jgi:hypothetical protein